MTREATRRQVLALAGAGVLGTAVAACTRSRHGTGTPSPTSPAPTSSAPPPSSSSPTPSASPTRPTFGQLAPQISGGLVLAGAPGYNASTILYNPKFVTRPQAIARCRTAHDVAACVRFAAEGGAPLALKNGGHSYGGWSSGTGLVADLTAMNGVTVDTAAKTATVGAGARLVEVYTALAAKGVSIAGGSCATVGISGLTLGGGQGVLTRAYGLTCDQLRSIDIITADGQQRTVDANNDPDLFWALRGAGGGSFGAVTALTFAVRPAPTVTVYNLKWSWSAASTVFAAWQQWALGVPREMWTTCKLFAYPGGSGQIIVAGAWIGSGSVQTQLARLLAGVPKPTSTYQGTGSYGDTMLGEANCSGDSAATCIANGLAPASRETFTATSSIVSKPLPAAGVTAIVNAVAAGANVPRMTAGGASFDVLGGAVADIGASDSAVPWRTALATVQHTAQWNTANARINPAAFDAYVRSLRAALAPWCGSAAYVNYADPGIADYATAYWGANLARLKQVKQTYDPGNVFSFAQSVPLS